MKQATTADWKTSPMPEDYVVLPPTDISFNEEEYYKIQSGFIPGSMEDKWFLFFENNTLYCHRSWTGIAVYEISFMKENDTCSIRQIKFNTHVYKKDHTVDLNRELELALFLIKTVLLDARGINSNG
jgi:hypothetical protein